MDDTEDKLFLESDNRSSKLDKKVLSMMKDGRKSELISFLKEKDLTLRLMEWEVMNIIGNFNSNNRNKRSSLKHLKFWKPYGLSKVGLENNVLKLELRGNESSAYPINEVFTNADFLENFDERQGMCHNICLINEKNVNVDCSVLTGFSYGLTDQSKYLHSVIKMQIGDFTRIIDTTMNTVMTEGFYKELIGFEVLTEVPKSQIEKDVEVLKGESGVELKEYFLYRDEYIEKLKARKATDKKIEEKKAEVKSARINANQKNKA